MQLSRGSRDSTVMLLFLPKGNFSVPWDGTGLTLWAAGAGGDRGHGWIQGRADPPGLEVTRGSSSHQQLLWTSPLSPCIPKSYPHLTFAVFYQGARPSHPASARPLWGSPSPPRSTRGSAELSGASAPGQQGRAGACTAQGCLCLTGGTRGVVLSSVGPALSVAAARCARCQPHAHTRL